MEPDFLEDTQEQIAQRINYGEGQTHYSAVEQDACRNVDDVTGVAVIVIVIVVIVIIVTVAVVTVGAVITAVGAEIARAARGSTTERYAPRTRCLLHIQRPTVFGFRVLIDASSLVIRL